MKKSIINIALSLLVLSATAQVDRSKMPEAGPAPKIELGEMQSFTMANGMKVFVVENHKLPRVTYSLELDLDPILEKDKVGASDLAGDMMSKGTTNRSKEELNFEIDFIGANFGSSASSMFGRSLTKHQEKLLEIMSDVVMNPAMNEEELDKLKKQYISGIQTEKDDPDAIANNVRRVLLYGKNHPYGEIMTEETVENVKLEDVVNYHQTYWRPNVAYMAVVGDITLKEAKTLVTKYFGKWEKKEVPTYTYEMPKQPEGMQVAFVNKPGAVQSVITVTNTIDLKPGSEDAIASAVTNGILGGGFVSKLNLNLREAHSYTYGARSSISSDEVVGSFSASAKVRNEVTDSALTEMMNEVNAMRAGNITEDELKTIKNYRTGIFAYSLENPQTKANFAINIEKYGLPADYYATYLKKLSAVSLEKVGEISKKYIEPNKGFMLVVGNQEEVAEKVKALSPNGQISFYDSYGNPVEETSMKAAPEGMTAESVIENYLTAVGGKKKIEAIKSMTQKGNMSMGPMQLAVETKFVMPDKYRSSYAMNGNVMQEEVLNGNKGYSNQMGNKQPMNEEQIAKAKEEVIAVSEMLYLQDGYELTLKGMDKVGEEEVYVVALKKPNGDESTNYYSTTSNLLVSSMSVVETPQGNLTQEVSFGEYKEVKGVKFPHKIDISAGPQKMSLMLDAIEVNPKLSDADFPVE